MKKGLIFAATITISVLPFTAAYAIETPSYTDHPCVVIGKHVMAMQENKAEADSLPQGNALAALCKTAALDKEPSIIVMTYEILARYYSSTHQSEQAVPLLEAAMRIDPNRPKDMWANIELASTYRESKQYDKSLNILDKLLLNPQQTTNMPIMYHIGRTFYEQGKYQNAVDALTIGLPLQPEWHWANWYRGLSYEKMGRIDKAVEDFKVTNTGLLKACVTKPADCQHFNKEALQTRKEVADKLIQYGIPVEFKLKND